MSRPIQTIEELYALPDGTICDVMDYGNPIGLTTTPFFKFGKTLYEVWDPNSYIHYQTLIAALKQNSKYDIWIESRDEQVSDPACVAFIKKMKQQTGYRKSHGGRIFHTKWYYINKARRAKKEREGSTQ